MPYDYVEFSPNRKELYIGRACTLNIEPGGRVRAIGTPVQRIPLLPTDGTATPAQMAAALNAIRSTLIGLGMADG